MKKYVSIKIAISKLDNLLTLQQREVRTQMKTYTKRTFLPFSNESNQTFNIVVFGIFGSKHNWDGNTIASIMVFCELFYSP